MCLITGLSFRPDLMMDDHWVSVVYGDGPVSQSLRNLGQLSPKQLRAVTGRTPCPAGVPFRARIHFWKDSTSEADGTLSTNRTKQLQG